MSGFRTPEQPRGQSVLWAHRLEDAIPQDHPVRLLDYLLHSEAFGDTFTAWAGEYVLMEGKPPKAIASTGGPTVAGLTHQPRYEEVGHGHPQAVWPSPGLCLVRPCGQVLQRSCQGASDQSGSVRGSSPASA